MNQLALCQSCVSKEQVFLQIFLELTGNMWVFFWDSEQCCSGTQSVAFNSVSPEGAGNRARIGESDVHDAEPSEEVSKPNAEMCC